MPEDFQAQLDALRAQIADLSARSERPVQRQDAPVAATAASVVPFWDVVYFQGVTMNIGAGEDWSLKLDQQRASATRWIHFELETATGHFEITDFGGANQRRFRILFDSPVARQATCQFSTDGVAGAAVPFYLQRKINGVVTETTSFDPFTIDIVAGRNSIHFTQITDTDTSAFVGRLFDNVSSKWVDPRNESGYMPD